MNKMFFVVFALFCAKVSYLSAADVDVYKILDQQLEKLTALSENEMTIVINLTEQELEVHRGQPNGEKTIVCAFPCSTGPGKYAMIPEGKKTFIYETGPGSDGNRPSYQSGGIMRHCLRLKMNNSDGSEAYVAIHSANGEYVPRLPTTHGCIRVPNRVAMALFAKVWDGKPGKVKGGVKRQIPVLFAGTTPTLDF